MRTCAKCGCEIVNGVNGCMLMDVCFDCNGGHPSYQPHPAKPEPSYEELDYLEGRCIDDEG